MKVSKNKVVSLTYELRVNSENGEIVETVGNETPLTYLAGSGNLLPKFENNLDGLGIGDKFDFKLECDDAYGEMREEAIVDVPIQAFEVDGKIDDNLLKLGNNIPMMDRDGNRLNGVIKDIASEAVTMDFNHPLAGEDLFFKGEIAAIRDATEDELQHGHVHGADSCGDCNHDEGCGHC